MGLRLHGDASDVRVDRGVGSCQHRETFMLLVSTITFSRLSQATKRVVKYHAFREQGAS